MPAETDAHHVVNFALVPIGGVPNVVTVGSLDFSSLTSVLSRNSLPCRQAAQMINHRPARVFAIIVHAADVHEIIEVQFRFCEVADFDDLPGVADFERDFATKFRRFGDQITELGFDFLGGFEGGHGSSNKRFNDVAAR